MLYGSGAFVNWYNGHPEGVAPDLSGVRSAVIIGNGNVAIDVARILAKDPGEMSGSDLAPSVSAALAAMPIETIHIVGRRGAADAKFTEHELAELGLLRRARPIIENPEALTGDSEVVETLRRFHREAGRACPIAIHFHFGLAPVAFGGSGRLEWVRFRRGDGSEYELAAQLAVTAIGYEARTCCTARPDKGKFASDGGKIGERLFVAGWARRGPTGTIPTNRTEAQEIAQRIAGEIQDSGRSGRVALRELLESREVAWTDYAGWCRIDAAEIGRAGEGRCRDKFTSIEEMIDAARGDYPSAKKS